MPKFQLLTALVALGGDKNNVVYRGDDDPITLPEMYILRAVHGGEDMVTNAVEIGETEERPHSVEKNRLRERYGAPVDAIFPGGEAIANLPVRDANLPTREQVKIAEDAAAAALAEAKKPKSKSRSKTADPDPAPVSTAPEADTPAPAPDVIPDLVSE